MKTYCEDYFSIKHTKFDISKEIACCFFLLLEKYDQSFTNLSQKDFASFLLKTLNYYLKDKNYKIKEENDLFLKEEEISLKMFSKFIDILLHYSCIFIKHNKAEYSKFLLSIGIDTINKSKFNSEQSIIKKKVCLANNIACTYILINNFIKSELFFEKCKENSKSSLDKIITYNNYTLIQIKKIKSFYKNASENYEMNSLIRNIMLYLKLTNNEINKRILNKYKIDLNYIKQSNNYNSNIPNKKNIFEFEVVNPKEEIFCFLIYNYFRIIKIFDYEEFDKNYANAHLFIRKTLGNYHLISIKMTRIGYEKNKEDSFYEITNSTNKNMFNLEELELQDSILSEKNNKNDIKKEIDFEIKNEIKKEKKKEIKNEIKKEAILEIKNELKKEIKEEIKPVINKEIKSLIKEEVKEEIKEEDTKKDNNINGILINKNNEQKENEEKKDNNLEEKKEQKKKSQPPVIKKTWKGIFQALTGKKLPGTENKLGNLFKSISKVANNNANGNKPEIKAQYNEFHEEMEKYLAEMKSENYITFNKTYSNSYTDEFIICIIDENNEEKKNFDKIGFEKSQQKEYQKKTVSLFVTSYFRSLLQKKTFYPQLIEDILDYDVLEKMNNLYANKKKNELYINKEIERIVKNSNKEKRISSVHEKNISNINVNQSENQNQNQNHIFVNFDEGNNFSFDSNTNISKTNKIETECYLDSDKYKISYINDYENKKIIINATKTKHSQKKESRDLLNNQFNNIKREIDYNDIYYYFSKYYEKGYSELCFILRYMSNINSFINRFLVQYVKLVTINKEPQLVMCKYKKGNLQKLNRRGRPEFTFMNEKCTFVFCKFPEKIEVIIYNLAYKSSLTIILSLDESSSSVFFGANKKGSNISGKIVADFEYNTNYKIFSRFSNFFIKLQKVLFFRDRAIKTFTEYAEKYKNNIHKLICNDSLINLDLWIISLEEKPIEGEKSLSNSMNSNSIIDNINDIKNRKVEFQWNIELFTITKLTISNGKYYVNKNLILTSMDFVNIIGCDYSDIYNILDGKDNYFCLTFLLGTVEKMKFVLIKMLNTSNYLTAFRLMKLKPISFFKYRFVFKHIKRYFICSLEYLVYSRENNFLRIMIMETITNRCYSKIYIPFYSIKKDLDTKETQAILIEKYEVINNLYQNKNKLKKFLSEECKALLTKNPSDGSNVLVLFENIEFLVERIKDFLNSDN